MTTDPVEILNRRNAEVTKIRGYADLTEEAKERRIAEVNERAHAEYAEAREAAELEIRERAEKAEKALFETPYPYAADDLEKAQIRALRRGAYDEVHNSSSSWSRRRPERSWTGSSQGRSARETPSLPTPSTTWPRRGARGVWPTPTLRNGRRRKGVGRSTSRPASRLPNPGAWSTSWRAG